MIIQANSLHIPISDESVQCCITSPPYWGLRRYSGIGDIAFSDGWTGEYGLEPSPEMYVAHTVEFFDEVWRVLRKDATCWVNLGDSYAMSGGCRKEPNEKRATIQIRPPKTNTLKPKDMCGIPWRVAFAMQARGWYLRSDIIWHKPNPRPESVTDRPTKEHEYLFLLTKSAKYFYDSFAVREPVTGNAHTRGDGVNPKAKNNVNNSIKQNNGFSAAVNRLVSSRNKRSVWTIATQPFSGSHFAVFPEALVVDPIKAGTSEKGCCSECGAPWERVIEKGLLVPDDPKYKPRGNVREHKLVNRMEQKDGIPAPNHHYESKTIGWQPTCKHDADVVPCTVLDIFGGSGTVKNVAERLGRRAVILELSGEYCKMAKKRCCSAQMSLV